jgi:hypothetical protein
LAGGASAEKERQCPGGTEKTPSTSVEGSITEPNVRKASSESGDTRGSMSPPASNERASEENRKAPPAAA